VEGTELLSKSISTFFETAILLIYSHGGDVVKFCGDALMCVFSSTPDENETEETYNARHKKVAKDKAAKMLGQTMNAMPSRQCQLAMQCALQQMEKLRGFVAAEGVVLDLKIMLGKVRLVAREES
jgi:class 3 adenylate cyclase